MTLVIYPSIYTPVIYMSKLSFNYNLIYAAQPKSATKTQAQSTPYQANALLLKQQHQNHIQKRHGPRFGRTKKKQFIISLLNRAGSGDARSPFRNYMLASHFGSGSTFSSPFSVFLVFFFRFSISSAVGTHHYSLLHG